MQTQLRDDRCLTAGLSCDKTGAGWQSRRRAPLRGSSTVDVAIVGGGFTGLWTAYTCSAPIPTLRVAVVEQEDGRIRRHPAATALVRPCVHGEPSTLAHEHGPTPPSRNYTAMRRCGGRGRPESTTPRASTHRPYARRHGGRTCPASAPQVGTGQRAPRSVASSTASGVELAMLDAAPRARLVATRMGGKSVQQLRSVCSGSDEAGARTGERRRTRGRRRLRRKHQVTPASNHDMVTTDTGRLHAVRDVGQTEGYTDELPAAAAIAPDTRSCIARSLPDSVWSRVGLAQRDVLRFRHMIIYGKRTADVGSAFRRRGAPYATSGSRHRTRSSRNGRPESSQDADHQRWRGCIQRFAEECDHASAGAGSLGVTRELARVRRLDGRCIAWRRTTSVTAVDGRICGPHDRDLIVDGARLW